MSQNDLIGHELSDIHHSRPTIRPARPEEAEELSALAIRSKGHWGYDEAFLESCREDLTLTPRDIAASMVVVAEGSAGLAGFYCLKPLPDADGVALLDDLFVDPAAIGQGVGRRLWDHAVHTAQNQGFSALEMQSDPHAEGFYTAMGARRLGELESTVEPGRMLPLLRYALCDS